MAIRDRSHFGGRNPTGGVQCPKRWEKFHKKLH